MAKKTRRVRRATQHGAKPRPPVTQPQPTERTQPAQVQPRSARPAFAMPASPARAVDFKEEYKYVARDLRHVAVISVSVLAILIILAQFVH